MDTADGYWVDVETVAKSIYRLMGGDDAGWLNDAAITRMEYRKLAERAIEARDCHN